MSGGDETVDRVVSTVGLWWPDAEEGDVRAAADAWDKLAQGIDDAYSASRGGVSQARANWTGQASEAFGRYWQTYDRAMPQSADASREIAKALREFADEVEHAKNQVRELAIEIGATIAVGTALAFFTFGATEAAAGGVAAGLIANAARIGVELSARAAAIGGRIAVGAAFGAVSGLGGDAVGQVARVEGFHDGGYSLPELGGAVVVGGATGGLLEGAGGVLGKLGRLRGGSGMPAAPRSLDDLGSLRGAPGRDVEGLLREEGWTPQPAKKGGGTRWAHPTNQGEQIIVEPGWPNATDPVHGGPYLKVSRNGTVERIPLEGNPGLK